LTKHTKKYFTQEAVYYPGFSRETEQIEYMCMYVYLPISIIYHLEREREREREIGSHDSNSPEGP
jgi:hypothetical protein